MASLRDYIECIILSGSKYIIYCSDDEFFTLTINRIGREKIDVQISHNLNSVIRKEDATIVACLYLDCPHHSPGLWIIYDNELPNNIVGFKNDMGPYRINDLDPIFKSLDKYWLDDSIKEAKHMVKEICKENNTSFDKVIENLLIQDVGIVYNKEDTNTPKDDE